MLSQEEQIKIIKKYKESKDENLLLEIINANIRLINKLAFSFYKQNRQSSVEDLKSCGYEGIILAINKFDTSKNDLFFLYAKTWIYAKMREYIMKNASALSIGGKEARQLFSNFYKIGKENEQSQSYSAFYNAMHQSASISSIKTEDDSDIALEEKISTSSIPVDIQIDKKNAQLKFSNELMEFQKTLPDIEKIILNERLLSESPKTLAEISNEFDCSNQAIFYLEKKIIKSLKKRIFNSKDKELFHTILE